MTIEAERRDWFEMSRVVDRALQTFKSTLPIGLPCVLLLVVIPEAAGNWLDGPARLYTNLGQMFDGRLAWGPMVYAIAAAVAGVLCQAALVCVSLATFRGRPMGAGEVMAASLRLLPAAVGISILTTIGIVLGLILLVVPGLMLMTIWVVALPVQAHGGPGVIPAIQDSGELTKGVRWQVFGLLLATGILLGIAGWFLQLFPRLLPESLRFLDDMLFTPVGSGLSALVSGYGTASLFHELKWGGRHSEEEATAEVFA
jgi:hypothetical protein